MAIEGLPKWGSGEVNLMVRFGGNRGSCAFLVRQQICTAAECTRRVGYRLSPRSATVHPQQPNGTARSLSAHSADESTWSALGGCDFGLSAWSSANVGQIGMACRRISSYYTQGPLRHVGVMMLERAQDLRRRSGQLGDADELESLWLCPFGGANIDCVAAELNHRINNSSVARCSGPWTDPLKARRCGSF